MLREIWVDVRDIRRDGTQARCRTYKEVVETYASDYENGDLFPLPDLFSDPRGFFWIGDGWHRIDAQIMNGNTRIRCRIVGIGGRDDALAYNAKCNKGHKGLQLTGKDKRHTVRLLLKIKKYAGWQDGAVGEMVGAHRSQVCVWRKELEGEGVKFPDVRVDPVTGATSDINKGKRGAETRKANRKARLTTPGIIPIVVGETKKKLEKRLVAGETKQRTSDGQPKRSLLCPHCGGKIYLPE